MKCGFAFAQASAFRLVLKKTIDDDRVALSILRSLAAAFVNGFQGLTVGRFSDVDPTSSFLPRKVVN